jgi:hypothetical protein
MSLNLFVDSTVFYICVLNVKLHEDGIIKICRSVSGLSVICIYSGPSSYDRLDIRTTWVTTNMVLMTCDQILSYDPHAGQGHLSYDPHGVRKL